MSNMFTPHEFGALIDFGHFNQMPYSSRLTVIWDFEVIGIHLRAQQMFATDPCRFDLSGFRDNELQWRVEADYERSQLPNRLFGSTLLEDQLVQMFATKWKCVGHPRLMCGDDDRFTNDLLMLRMAKDLWVRHEAG